jgi:hypothetical protein
MKTLRGQNFVHDTNYTLYPDGSIQNEIEGEQDGTPVVREVYNDLLVSIYAYLRNRNIAPNQIDDNANNGYQLIQALQRNVNILNDTEKILAINGSTWNLNIDFNLIPSKYFVFARAADDYDSSIQFLKGTDGAQFAFSPANFKTGDELLLILDHATIRTYNISSSSTVQSAQFPVFGQPLSYLANTNKVWYEKDGYLYSDFPENYNINQVISTQIGLECEIRSIVQIGEKIVCMVFLPNDGAFRFFYFNIGSFNLAIELTPPPDEILVRYVYEDNLMFSNGESLFIVLSPSGETNFEIESMSINFTSNQLTRTGSYELESSYIKTTNSVMNSQGIIGFEPDGRLNLYRFNGSKVELGFFNNFVGNIFRVGENIYFNNGSNATKWNI